jgi:hypothetical protein
MTLPFTAADFIEVFRRYHEALLASPPVARILHAVPLAWPAIGGFAAFPLGMGEDLTLPDCAAAALAKSGLWPRRASVSADHGEPHGGR